MLEQRSVTLRHDGNNRGVAAAASARGVDEDERCSHLSLLIGSSRRPVNGRHDGRSQM